MTPLSSDQDHLRWLTDLGLIAMKNLSLLDVGCDSGYIYHQAMEEGAISAIGIHIVTPKGLTEKSPWRFNSFDAADRRTNYLCL